jgi:DNA adenine methylase
MAVALSMKGPVFASDIHAPLIALYSAVRAGWDPPASVDAETYAAARALPDSDPLKAFAGFGCSYGGKWFGGYAKANPDHPRGYATHARSALLRDCMRLADVACLDFFAVEPGPAEFVIYLDPPYAGTTGYAGVAPFDHDRFVQRVRAWAEHTPVFVSEYDFPIGECVAEIQTSAEKRLRQGAVERLYFVYNPKG